jgi:hypothetical protein
MLGRRNDKRGTPYRCLLAIHDDKEHGAAIAAAGMVSEEIGNVNPKRRWNV